MNIVAIIGSPRKTGVTSTVVSEILSGAKGNDHHCETIYISDLTIKDCRGCMTCQEKGRCVIRDDIEKVQQAIMKSDVIIWASPTHWANVSAMMLRLFERLFGFLIREKVRGFPIALNANGKKAILVTACSTIWPMNWLFNQSRACFSRMREMCRYSGQKIIATLVVSGTITKKQVPQKYLKKARTIGHNIK